MQVISFFSGLTLEILRRRLRCLRRIILSQTRMVALIILVGWDCFFRDTPDWSVPEEGPGGAHGCTPQNVVKGAVVFKKRCVSPEHW